MSKVSTIRQKVHQAPITLVFFRLTSLIVPFLCLPIILQNVGTTTLGQFYLIFSLVSILGFMDFGIPNSLPKLFAGVSGESNAKFKEAEIVLTSLYRLSIIGVITTATIYISTLIFPYVSLFGLRSKEAEIFFVSLVVSTFSIFIKFFGNLGLKILSIRNDYASSQKYENICMSAGYLCATIFTYFRDDLLTLILTLISLPAVLLVFSTQRAIRLVVRSSRVNFFKRSHSSIKFAKLNFLFIYLQITTIVMLQVDSLVVGTLLSTDQVSILNLGWKFFSIPYLITVTVYSYIWIDASKIKNLDKGVFFYKQILDKARALLFVSFLIAVVIFFGGRQLLSIWSDGIYPSRLFCFAAGILLCMSCGAYPITMFLNGVNFSVYLIRMATLNMILNIIASIFLTNLLKDPAGVLLGSALAQFFGFYVPFYFVFIKNEGYKMQLKGAL